MDNTFLSFRSRAQVIFRRYSLPRWMVFAFDGSAVFITFFFSYFLRYNFEPWEIDFGLALKQSFIVLTIYCSFELVFRSFVGLIRHTTVRDIFTVILATLPALFLLLLLTILSRRFAMNEVLNIPISIILIHFVTINLILFLFRILIKMMYEIVISNPEKRKNVIIFGAGSMGVIVKRVIASDSINNYNVVAFLDNNRSLQNKTLSGIPVYSPQKLKRTFLEKYGIDTLIFAIMDIPPSEKSKVFKFALDIGLEVLEVPAVNSWLNDQFQLNQLKPINVQDLLGRDPIQLNLKMIHHGLAGKSILVTGAAGSIGSEIVRQLGRFNIEKLYLIDNAETPMFHLENELCEHFPHVPVKTILGDVTDEIKMNHLFSTYHPDIVFHAAAYKHVPLMEENPHEAIRVNVNGTMLLTKLSMKYKVGKFVMVSTDKAVNPTNIMGASKRMCEMILRSRSQIPGNSTSFIITRFGNVLGSNGSVIPIFRRQIESGGPITVTHPDITRYFMTIPEACQLVLEAGFMGMGGEIFVFDMGEPVRIVDLARRMIRLSGFVPDKDIGIEFIGLRPGEKLYEELLTQKEKTLPTYNKKVMVAEVDTLDHNMVLAQINTLLYSYRNVDAAVLAKKILEIVPEYSPNNERYSSENRESDAVELEVFPD